jgi:preprotein translocase subunit SecF
MLDRLIGTCFAILAAAVAIYIAVRLIESVAATLMIIVAVIVSVLIAGVIVHLLWRRHRIDRW